MFTRFYRAILMSIFSRFSGSGVLNPASGGTGINNGTNALTVPATGTAALLGTANEFTATQTIDTANSTHLLIQTSNANALKLNSAGAGATICTTFGADRFGGDVSGANLGSSPVIEMRHTTRDNASGVFINNGNAFGWADGDNASGTIDTALEKHADGVVKVTNASTGIRGFLGGGTAIASGTAMPLPTGRVFHVTGTTAITSIISTNFQAGAVITLIFDDVLTFTDGNNLKLAGNFTTSADDTITLAYDGSNWYECCRSAN